MVHGNGFFISFWVFIAQTRRLWEYTFNHPPPISISSFHFSLCSNKLNLVLQCSGFSCWSVCMELNLEIWLQAPQFPIEIYAIVNHDKTISWQQHHQAAPTERCIFFGYMCDMFSVSTLQSIIRQNRFMLSTALIEIIFNCLSASSRYIWTRGEQIPGGKHWDESANPLKMGDNDGII